MAKPTIAYIAQYFPYMTETFVYREVNALRAKGFNIVTLSNRTPDPAKLADESKEHIATTEYVFPLQKRLFVQTHLFWLLRHPLLYLGTLWKVMSPRAESWDSRKRTFGHFGGGVYLAYRLREQGVDHIHAHFSVNAATIGLVIARLLRVSYSFTVHNNIFSDRLILREKLKAARFIVSISRFSRDFLLRYAPDIPGLADKFEIVHCGIAPEQFQPRRQTSTERARSPLIFSLAHHAERKGMPYLVEACRILRERQVDFECIVGGQGPETPRLHTLVARYGLEQHVKLPGVIFQQDLQPYLNQAAAFVLPCITAHDGDVDGIPVVLMEAMAMGVPSVSTFVSGIPELIDDGVSGLLVPEKDAVALADALERVLHDAALAARLGEAAREKVLAQFDIHQSADQLGDLFERRIKA
jgi:glycosyltransferase involved in cell wall biosynthesis